jgi:hypothetical protein
VPLDGFDDGVDEPATDDEINQWWSRFAVQLIGFTAAGHDGPEGVAHWLAVARNQADHAVLYRLCGTINDKLPWAMPGASVTCMTCLVRAARERWREPS